MDDLARKLKQSVQIDSLAINFLSNYEDRKKPNKKLFKKVIDNRLTRGVNEETELFAHGECAVYSEGLINVLDSLGYDSTLVALIDKGTPIHYLAKIEHEGNDLYIDAYGVFESLDAIENRYTNNSVDEVVELDVFDENEEGGDFIEVWQDRTCNFMDCFDFGDRLEELNMSHHSEAYEDFLISTISKAFEDIWLKNKDLVPSTPKAQELTM